MLMQRLMLFIPRAQIADAKCWSRCIHLMNYLFAARRAFENVKTKINLKHEKAINTE